MTRMYPWCHRVSSRRRRRTEHRHQTSRRLFLKDGAEGGVVACATAAQEMIRKFGEHIGMENASAERGPAAPPSAEDAAAAQPRGADRKDTVSERVKSLDAKGAPKLAKILNHVQLQNSFFPSLPTHVPGKNARLLTVHERDSSAAGSLGSIGMANSLPGGMQHGSLSRRMRSSLDGSMPLRSSLDSPARSSLESHPQRSSLDSPSRRSNEERAQSQLDWPAPGSPAVSDELKSGASQSQSQLPRAATISAPASIPQGGVDPVVDGGQQWHADTHRIPPPLSDIMLNLQLLMHPSGSPADDEWQHPCSVTPQQPTNSDPMATTASEWCPMPQMPAEGAQEPTICGRGQPDAACTDRAYHPPEIVSQPPPVLDAGDHVTFSPSSLDPEPPELPEPQEPIFLMEESRIENDESGAAGRTRAAEEMRDLQLHPSLRVQNVRLWDLLGKQEVVASRGGSKSRALYPGDAKRRGI
ncbi:hypothetical protein CYMTET_8836 [Cymbomonas tetramitiformis]|uniref:Uncharacterized protein n=1 Tax=Cymbomonas tetramitiformis TaxID=36881 RepID=A0AAE0GSP2_9CHLO|nr:hypothetical protein CYMTET_8836 [Cymbomonas tetramitiformis]